MPRRRLVRLATLLAVLAAAPAAQAQVLGTFRWNVAPFCGVLTLSVTQQGSIYTLDGFEDQCGGNPRLPTVGVAVPQADGTISMGLTSVSTHGAALHTIVSLSPATLSGSWQDDAQSSGAFVFSPAATSGGPRTFPPTGTSLPAAFSFQADGGWVARGQEDVGSLPATGPGVRSMWFPAEGAFRAGAVSGAQWNLENIGQFSVALGYNSRATTFADVALGNETLASGGSSTALGYATIASGGGSVAMGTLTRATGASAFAAGTNTIATHFGTALGSWATTNSFDGTFIFGDRSTLSYIGNTAPNQFVARAANGYRLYTNAAATTGVVVAPGGGSWSSVSDVDMKSGFRELDGADVLAKLARMPVREWSYTSQDASIRHAGPTAQDFHAAFGLGEDPLKITTVDADGIALRAVQALIERNDALRAEVESLRIRLEQLERPAKER